MRQFLIVFGIVLYFAGAPWIARPVTRALVGWNGGVILFLGLALNMMHTADLARMKRQAISHDEGGRLILFLTVLAAVASVGALIAELTIAKGNSGVPWRVALAAGTVVISWAFVQIVFAMHYAHVYYLEEEEGRPKGGLQFGECGEPDYWDFGYFAFCLGMTFQTSDVSVTDRGIRKVVTLHCLAAFVFNLGIVAFTINVLGG